jgi:hypothetical protein
MPVGQLLTSLGPQVRDRLAPVDHMKSCPTCLITGFGYDINAIQKGNENELVKSFNALIDTRPSLWRLFKAFFPLLGNLVSRCPLVSVVYMPTSLPSLARVVV